MTGMYRVTTGLAVLAIMILAVGCNGSTRTNGDPTQGAKQCERLMTQVETLYRDQVQAAEAKAAPETDDDATQARRQEQISDDVAMVLTDCRADPERALPCIRSATSVEQLERDCLLPLDDKGEVEGRAFGSNPNQ